VSRLLAWRAADREDQTALQGFTCTVPAQRVFGQKRKYHPKPWELIVQSGIRVLRPPVTPDQSLLLGEDEEGIAAVCLLAQQEDASTIKIQAIAVATRYRGQGGACGDEALQVALEATAERGRNAGIGEVLVVGWVDPRNNASKLLNQRAGFTYRRNTPDGLEEWALLLNLDQPERPG
jgi:GNAT superfamily N-acetyltransferase